MAEGRRKPGRPKGARTKDPAQRRRELVEAAVNAVRRVGAEASMDDIASEAGITKAVLYDHFAGKDGLKRAVVEQFGVILLSELQTRVAVDRTPEVLLRDAIDAFTSFVEQDPALFRFATRAEHSLQKEAGAVFAAMIGESLLRVGADPSGAEVFAAAALGAVFAAVEDWVARQSMDRAEFVDHLTSMLWDGLGRTGLAELEGAVAMGPALAAVEAGLADVPPG